jgi:hypothetical protein
MHNLNLTLQALISFLHVQNQCEVNTYNVTKKLKKQRLRPLLTRVYMYITYQTL